MAKGKEINLRVGRGTQRGEVSVSTFPPEAVTLRVSYKGGRAAAVLLTEEQVRLLRHALDEIAQQVEARGEEKLRLAA
jgi:hypothetical protein